MENECCCCDLALVVSVRLCMRLLETLAAVSGRRLECCQPQGNGYHLSFLHFGFFYPFVFGTGSHSLLFYSEHAVWL